MIRKRIIVLWTFLFTAVMAGLAVILSFLSRNEITVHKIGRFWAKHLLATANIKVTVKGFSNLNLHVPYIYMANHTSNFDIPVLQACLPVSFRWLAKVELFKIPIFGHAMKRAGYISIDRSNKESAIQSLKQAATIIKKGASVIIFPEGTRSRNQNVQPFKKGGFVLAVDSGVPIVPVILHGTWKIMPKNQMVIEPGHVSVEIKKPIESSEYSRETKDFLMEKVRNVILESLENGQKNGSLC
jgi:1-acyl-sn-glycerol-3-phosphate acyltransferase